MNMDLIKKFLLNECGYKSIEDAIKNTPKINLYPIYGEVNRIKVKEGMYERVNEV